MEEQGKLSEEAKQGFGYAEGADTNLPRNVRRSKVKKMKRLLPLFEHEMRAVQEAFDKNFPDELEGLSNEDRWELLEEDNKTRKALFYQRLFEIELYYTAIKQFISTNGTKDLLQELSMQDTAEEFAEKLQPLKEKEGND